MSIHVKIIQETTGRSDHLHKEGKNAKQKQAAALDTLSHYISVYTAMLTVLFHSGTCS